MAKIHEMPIINMRFKRGERIRPRKIGKKGSWGRRILTPNPELKGLPGPPLNLLSYFGPHHHEYHATKGWRRYRM